MKNIISIVIKTVVTTFLSFAVFDGIIRAGWKYLAGSRVPDNSLLYVYLPIAFIIAASVFIHKKHPKAFWFIVIACISLIALLEVGLFLIPAQR